MTVDGQPKKAVAEATKQGWLYIRFCPTFRAEDGFAQG
jgi:hypothetical protein